MSFFPQFNCLAPRAAMYSPRQKTPTRENKPKKKQTQENKLRYKPAWPENGHCVWQGKEKTFSPEKKKFLTKKQPENKVLANSIFYFDKQKTSQTS